jgi:hypothetical protein
MNPQVEINKNCYKNHQRKVDETSKIIVSI